MTDDWEFLSGEERTEMIDDTSVDCVVGKHLDVWFFPAHAPELNSMELWWNRLEVWFNFRLIENLEELQTMLHDYFEDITLPDI